MAATAYFPAGRLWNTNLTSPAFAPAFCFAFANSGLPKLDWSYTATSTAPVVFRTSLTVTVRLAAEAKALAPNRNEIVNASVWIRFMVVLLSVINPCLLEIRVSYQQSCCVVCLVTARQPSFAAVFETPSHAL